MTTFLARLLDFTVSPFWSKLSNDSAKSIKNEGKHQSTSQSVSRSALYVCLPRQGPPLHQTDCHSRASSHKMIRWTRSQMNESINELDHKWISQSINRSISQSISPIAAYLNNIGPYNIETGTAMQYFQSLVDRKTSYFRCTCEQGSCQNQAKERK